MEKSEIKKEARYMNPTTGSVDTGENWLADFEAREDKDQSFAGWCPAGLIEVNEHGEEIE